MKVRSTTVFLSKAVLILTLIVGARTAHAQVLYGSLTGNVTDQTRAVIPGASVEALNVDTGATQSAITDERGIYLLSNLQVGVYKVTVMIRSFRPQVHESVRLDGNAIRRLDVQLQIGDVSATVEVTAAPEVIKTDRADVSTVQTARQINDLPLAGSVGRNYQSLMGLIPGAINQGEQNSQAGSPQRSISFNVNGVSRLQNNTRIDGSSVIYPYLPTNTAYVPPAEAIQEVNIVTNSMDAEQGLAGGAAVNVTIRSGTNALHGAGWLYDTNSATQARNYFQTTPQVPKSIVAQYGYAVGGPIVKDRLFFFTDLERSTQRNTSRINTVSIAPPSLRPDSSGNVVFPAAANGGATIYDPASNVDPALRTPFLNNTIPANRIDIAALEFIKRLAAPTGPGFVNNFVANGVASFNRTNIDSKVNYILSDKLSLFARYSISPTNIIDPPLLGDAGGGALNGGQLGNAPGRTQIAGVGGTYVVRSNLILDANVGYTRQRLGAEAFDINSNFGLNVLKIPGTNGPDRLQGGIPSFQISGWQNLGNDQTGNPFLFRDNQYVGTANLSWQKAAHSVRFGADYQNQQLNHFQPQGGTFQTVRGTFTFNGNATRLQNGPAPADTRFNSWADFLLGLPITAGKVDQLRNPNALRMLSYALYVRDHWQATRSLTITYGARWERYPFPDKDNTGINRFDPATGNVLTGGLSGVPRDTGAKSGAGRLLPRIGLAYRLGKEAKMVVRAGYGQSTDPRPFIDFRNAYPVVNAWAMPAIVFNGSTNAFIPVTTLRQGLINTSVAPDLTQGVLKLPANSGTTTYPAEPKRKYIQSWNLTVERELPWNLVAEAGYVGTRAVGQMGYININAAAPGTGNAGRALAAFGLTADINEVLPYQTATYDALQMQLKRRWASSLFGVAYTFSKAINFADNDANPRIQYYPEARRNRGVAGYDRTHNLQTYGVWDLPFGRGQRWAPDGIASRVLGGFQLNGVMSITNGAPFSVVQGNAGNLNAPGSSQYPDQIKPEVTILDGIGLGNPYFDTTAYSAVNIPSGQPQRFGNAGRNNLRGPGFFNMDLGLFRTFSLTERLRMQFRAEALNALNHPNFGTPGADVSNTASLGFVISTVGQGSRVFRFAARVSF